MSWPALCAQYTCISNQVYLAFRSSCTYWFTQALAETHREFIPPSTVHDILPHRYQNIYKTHRFWIRSWHCVLCVLLHLRCLLFGVLDWVSVSSLCDICWCKKGVINTFDWFIVPSRALICANSKTQSQGLEGGSYRMSQKLIHYCSAYFLQDTCHVRC